MIYKCKNCAGNMVYSPERGKMYCAHCESEDSHHAGSVENLTSCANCGGELLVSDYTAATKCEYCGSYFVFDERVSGEYEPHLILPFLLGKKEVKERIREVFKKKIFAPMDFLTDARLEKMEGMYVPFFMYDYHAAYEFAGKGTKVRVWRLGNKEYTETSLYDVCRNMEIEFQKIPVDASVAMDDGIMDLMEPYDYRALEDFQEKYMAGFYGERYSQNKDELEPRANEKAKGDSELLLNQSLTEYSTVTPTKKNLELVKKGESYALLPVWVYSYSFRGEIYPFHVNGQTGKVIGKAPISWGKVCIYGGTVLIGTMLIGMLLRGILGVL